jgi:hypothetical protein
MPRSKARYLIAASVALICGLLCTGDEAGKNPFNHGSLSTRAQSAYQLL